MASEFVVGTGIEHRNEADLRADQVYDWCAFETCRVPVPDYIDSTGSGTYRSAGKECPAVSGAQELTVHRIFFGRWEMGDRPCSLTRATDMVAI